MTILTPTEYSALCNILEWAWTAVHQEPELCLGDVHYYHPDKPDDYNPVLDGKCGLGLAEELECSLEQPYNQRDVMDMLSTLMYKLNANPILANGLGNTWETLSPLVDKQEMDRLYDLNDPADDKPMQSLEQYKVEDLGKENQKARLQEYMNVDENGMVDIGDGIYLDAVNSDFFE